MKKKNLRSCCQSVFVFLLVIVSLFPFLYLIFLSFFSREGTVSVQQYYNVFLGTSDYLFRFWKSVLLGGCIVMGNLVLSVLAGFGFAKFNFKGKSALFFLLLIIMILPLQVTLVPNYMMLEQFNLLDTYWSLLLPSIFAPLGTFIMTRSFKSVPEGVMEAACLDGAGLFQTLCRVMVPMNKSGIVSVILLSYLDAWNMVEQPIAYLKDFERYPISVALAFEESAGSPEQVVCCLFVLLPPLFLFIRFHEELIKGIVLAEVK